MLRRRMYATRERGLRVDAVAACASGEPVPMGGRLDHDRGDLRFRLDIGGAAAVGRTLRVQVLQTGDPLPTVVGEAEFEVGGDGPVPVVAPVDRADGEWVVLRVTDPARSADSRSRRFPDYRSAGRSVAYLSPWFLGRA
jgi:hypothetical protein